MTGAHHGPGFQAPWQARAFALAVALRDRGQLSWPEFQRRVAEQVAADPHRTSDYYQHWLSALEALARRPTTGH